LVSLQKGAHEIKKHFNDNQATVELEFLDQLDYFKVKVAIIAWA